MTKQERIDFELPKPYAPFSELVESIDFDLIPDLLDFRLSGKAMKHYEAFNMLIHIEMIKKEFSEEKEAIASLVEEYNKFVCYF